MIGIEGYRQLSGWRDLSEKQVCNGRTAAGTGIPGQHNGISLPVCRRNVDRTADHQQDDRGFSDSQDSIHKIPL